MFRYPSQESDNIVHNFETTTIRNRKCTKNMDRDLRSACAQIGGDDDVEVSIDEIWHNPPVVFDADCVDCVREAARTLEYAHQDIVSGAGHDACQICAMDKGEVLNGVNTIDRAAQKIPEQRAHKVKRERRDYYSSRFPHLGHFNG